MYVVMDDSGNNENKTFIAFICNNTNGQYIKGVINDILCGLKSLNSDISEIHFVDFLHSHKDFFFCKDKKIVETSKEKIINNKESKYSFFEFFSELVLAWLESGIIDRIFVVDSNDWKDNLRLELEKTIDQEFFKNFNSQVHLIVPLMKKCSHYIYSNYDDEELPIHYIADNYRGTNKKEFELDEQIYFGKKIAFENSNENALIQIADFLAFSYNRFYSSPNDLEFCRIVKPVIDLIQK